MSNPYYRGPVSDHFDGERFFHPGLPSADKSLSALLRWRLGSRPSPWPPIIPAQSCKPAQRVQGLEITHIGHASLLVQMSGLNILVDPVWSERASPFSWIGPRRHNAPGVAFGDLPPIDAVLVSHNHYDHLDLSTLKRLGRAHDPRILTPLGNDTLIRSAAPEARLEAGDWWASFSLSANLRATIVPSYHWSSRNIRDRRMALWGGFVLESAGGTVYLAGDTAYRDGAIFRDIHERFGDVRVAVLPIGAYAPRWFMDTQHTSPAEAVHIAETVGARTLLGVHWGTFQLTDEPWNEPPLRLQKAVSTFQPRELQVARAMLPGDRWQG